MPFVENGTEIVWQPTSPEQFEAEKQSIKEAGAEGGPVQMPPHIQAQVQD